jgi:hypothetical protein
MIKMNNLIYYTILIPFLIKLPTINIVFHKQLEVIPNIQPYYYHCARYNAAMLELQKYKKYKSTCWMNYTTPVWILNPPKYKINIPRRITASRQIYLDNPFIFRTTRITEPLDGLL